ncbi:MAG: protein kinase [Chitinophagales bacterium]
MNIHINNILKSIEYQLGTKIDSHQTLSDRRGSVVLKIESNHMQSLVKITDLNFEHPVFSKDEKRIIAEREVTILKYLKEQRTSFDYYITDGSLNNYHWLLMRYIQGESILEVLKKTFAETPKTEEFQQKIIVLFVSILKKINELHKVNILHGDIQPAHFKIDTKGDVHILDFELSRLVNEKTPLYAGALMHFVAPEIAKGMLEKSKYIEYDIYSETYAIIATLFFLYTKKVPINYGTENIRKMSFSDALKAVLSNQILSFPDLELKPFPILEQLFEQGLKREKKDRYNSIDTILSAILT